AALMAAPASQPLQAHTNTPTVRVAAIGGVNDSGFWQELVSRFEKSTNIQVKTVATGNKDAASDLFRRGGIDVISLKSSNANMDLVASGHALALQPWAFSDLLIVGPQNDPAGIKGMTDADAAIRRIFTSKSSFFIHASLGADQVVRASLAK